MNTSSRTQIVATIGPASGSLEVLEEMEKHQMDVVRLNFSHGTLEDHAQYISNIRSLKRKIPIIQDLPGPRVQLSKGHTYDRDEEVITDEDKEYIKFAREKRIDYIAVSYVKNADNVREAKELAGNIPIIAKIEREEAIANIDEIIDAADGIMIARGDLGDNVPLETIPFVQIKIIEKCKLKHKPVITATEMMLSMVKNKRPSRAEVTDVAYAIIHGSDAVMLSEETAKGKYPVETVAMMERITLEAEKVIWGQHTVNLL